MAPSKNRLRTNDITRRHVASGLSWSPVGLSNRQLVNNQDRDRGGRNRGDRGTERTSTSDSGSRGGNSDANNSRRGGSGGGSNRDTTNDRGRDTNDSGGGGRRGGFGFTVRVGGEDVGTGSRRASNRFNFGGSGGSDNEKPPTPASPPPPPATELAVSATPGPTPNMPAAAEAPEVISPVASVSTLTEAETAPPINNAADDSLLSSTPARDTLPEQATAAVSVRTVTQDPSTIILLSTVLPDFISTLPFTTAIDPSPSATSAFITSTFVTSTATTTTPAVSPVDSTSVMPTAAAETVTPDVSSSVPQQQQQSGNGMDGTSERVVISFGSIAAFILVGFVVWIIWKKRQQAKRQRELGLTSNSPEQKRRPFGDLPAFYHKMAAKIPFLKERQELPWQTLDEKAMRKFPPRSSHSVSSAEPAFVPPALPAKPFYGNGKSMNQPLSALPPLQTQMKLLSQEQVGMSPGAMAVSAGGIGSSPTATNASAVDLELGPNQMQQLHHALVGTGAGSPSSKVNAAALYNHPASGSLLSVNAAGATLDSNRAQDGTLQGYYLNQNNPFQQAPNGYDPRTRASLLSSISSGFGDGDIIIPQGPLPSQPTAAQMAYMQTQAQSSLQQQSLNVAGSSGSRTSSWTSRSNRDTIYTESSEDSPPRFRSVSSWVNQQTSRLRRADQRAQDEANVPPVPGVPAPGRVHDMPPEPQLNMMMEDGQAPRAPESVLNT